MAQSASAYQLATYLVRDVPRAGIVVDDHLLDVSEALSGSAAQGTDTCSLSVLEVLQRWGDIHPRLQAIARQVRAGRIQSTGRPLSGVKLGAPILYPGTIFCAGANYRDHVEEMSRALNLPPEPDPHQLGLKPWHFIKASAACVRGPDSPIALPAYSKKVDWEAEIAIVIGRECRDVPIERALSHVAGLTIVNDLSARDHLRRSGVAPESPFCFDWVSQKCFDGALPMGPWITPLDDIPEPGRLGVRLWVNRELMQDSSSANLIFSMAEQISHLSSRLTLRPGDVIATGTPAGCGTARGRFLRAGDHVRIQVDGVGELNNDFTA
jgi:2-keto-4-pentenoate hydratase/2-oxohepta-3-ene-1,7-dioic acid hydratase in catechol pathway